MKEDTQMNKAISMIALAALLSLGLITSNSHASGRTGKSGFKMLDSSNLIGATVKDSRGEFVGVVNGVTVDSGGHASVIVNHWDFDLIGPMSLDTPVSFQELRIYQGKTGHNTVVFKTEMEHLGFAPYNPFQTNSRQHEYSVSRYYGIQPHWTGSGTAGKSGLMEFNSLNLEGAAVKDSCGKVIGIVNEVMVDSDGHAFAVINHGDTDLYGESGVNTPVPFQELRIHQGKGEQDTVALKTDMEHLDFAPYLDPARPINREREANLYLYYGIQPNWTRSGE
jgi:sporulation protein YlmC with PRC-barrel domain